MYNFKVFISKIFMFSNSQNPTVYILETIKLRGFNGCMVIGKYNFEFFFQRFSYFIIVRTRLYILETIKLWFSCMVIGQHNFEVFISKISIFCNSTHQCTF